MLGTNIKIKFKYLVERIASKQHGNDFCVSSLRIEIYLCAGWNETCIREGDGGREKKWNKDEGAKPVTITEAKQWQQQKHEREKHFSIINKANKRQMKMEKLGGKVLVGVASLWGRRDDDALSVELLLLILVFIFHPLSPFAMTTPTCLLVLHSLSSSLADKK